MIAVILLVIVGVIYWLVKTPPGYVAPDDDLPSRAADWVFSDDRNGCVVPIIIIAAVVLWGLILDNVVGLDTLRRLLGWTLY